MDRSSPADPRRVFRICEWSLTRCLGRAGPSDKSHDLSELFISKRFWAILRAWPKCEGEKQKTAWIGSAFIFSRSNDYSFGICGRYHDPCPRRITRKEDRMMKASRTAATYYKENSCIEDVIAIANEIARGAQPAAAPNVRQNKASPQRMKKHKGS